jgi:hypothetical protein
MTEVSVGIVYIWTGRRGLLLFFGLQLGSIDKEKPREI